MPSICSSPSASTPRRSVRGTPSGPSSSPTSGATEVKSTLLSSATLPVRPKGGTRRRCSTPRGHPAAGAMVTWDVTTSSECHFDLTKTKPPPATTPASFRTSCADTCAGADAITSPCFGCREFPANFREWPGGGSGAEGPRRTAVSCSTASITDPAGIRSQFFRAKLVDGVMESQDVGVYDTQKH